MGNLTAAMNEILAANIRTVRERLGFTQDVFAEKMEVTQATVSRWEKGAEPEAKSLTRLADWAGCTVGQFTTQLITGKPHAGEVRATLPNGSMLLLPVLLPNEGELTAMFEALLEGLKNETNGDVLALRLAQRLPVALAQTVARSAVSQGGLAAPTRPGADPSPPSANS